MKKTFLLIFLCSISFACSEKRKTDKANDENKVETITPTTQPHLKENPKYHNNENPNNSLIVSPDLNSIFPKNEDELEEWKRKVYEEGNSEYFDKLILCNTYNKTLRKEGYKGYNISDNQMRYFAYIMIEKQSSSSPKKENYKYLYIKYTEFSDSVMQEDIKTAIKYAYDLLRHDTINSLIKMQAREFIDKHENKYILKTK